MSDPDTMATRAGAKPRFTVRTADDPTYDVDPGKGWILFAGIMLAIVGSLNLIFGIVVQFLVMPAYPAWGLMVFFVDVIVIFGLVNYGGRDRHSLA